MPKSGEETTFILHFSFCKRYDLYGSKSRLLLFLNSPVGIPEHQKDAILRLLSQQETCEVVSIRQVQAGNGKHLFRNNLDICYILFHRVIISLPLSSSQRVCDEIPSKLW